jgi:tRNA-splicing ligase RtcB
LRFGNLYTSIGKRGSLKRAYCFERTNMRVIDTERIPIKLWLKDIEDDALEQAKNLAKLPFAYKWVAIMPDSHQGYGMPIGGVLATQQVIVPNAVGVDIGCGMSASKTSLTDIDTSTIKEIMGEIRKAVPVGFSHQKEAQEWTKFDQAPDIQIIQKELTSAKSQIGTLGGGNHFIEIQKGSDGFIWVMLHSGSRNFGLKTATEYHKKAQSLCEKWLSDIPDKDLAFLPLDTQEGQEYLTAMNYCLDFAYANRALMMDRVLEIFRDKTGATKQDEVNIHHNYAIMEHHYGKNVLVHRKGATKASLGLRGIIPGSMGTKSYIVEGLGNPESFESCSHGAGRRMGRKEATRTLVLEDEQAKMGSVVHGLRTQTDLDEAPGAYKDIDVVMKNQEDLVKIVVELTPLASIKG